MENIVLVGFAGTGKTQVAHEIAGISGRKLLDTNEEIVLRQGKSISTIKEIYGEDYFRDLESDIITNMESISAADPLVVAAGEGAVLREENRECLRRMGRVFWLKASLEEILDNIKREGSHLLMYDDLEERVREMLAEREDLYRSCAQGEVHIMEREPREVAVEILNQMENQGLEQ